MLICYFAAAEVEVVGRRQTGQERKAAATHAEYLGREIPAAADVRSRSGRQDTDGEHEGLRRHGGRPIIQKARRR